MMILSAGFLCAQEEQADKVQIRVTPASLDMKIGDQAQLTAQALDVGGRPTEASVFFFSRDRRSVSVDRSGKVKALKPGKFTIVARIARRSGPSAIVQVNVAFPTPASIEFRDTPSRVFAGTTARASAVILDKSGFHRKDLMATLTSSDNEVATVDTFGMVTGHRSGKCKITAAHSGLTTAFDLEVRDNPVSSIELTTGQIQARTGDVVHFRVHTKDSQGQPVAGVPVFLSLQVRPDDTLGNSATGQIKQDGRFVAEKPGVYTVIANCGQQVARCTLKVVARNVQKKAVFVGHGPIFDVHTSDLWVWEGADGRDYCVTGTWGGNGEAIFWDVTNPAKMERVATVKVDARTVNDVKVSENGRICVISREGASNRKNGMIVLDVTNPRSPKRLSTFTKNLTGGVHNVFIDKNYVYALSAGRRYDVIDIRDPEVPYRVGSYELTTARHSIHDVWVTDGIAYSSNWSNGIHLVDVGNGIKGGSPSKPVKIASYAYPSGWNHAAFPYRSKATGKFYVIAGDETFPFGLSTNNKPTYARGWFHFIDFTDLDNPQEIARYEVPEAGTHNLWVEGDVLYGAYYNAGVRVVDISGELMGDLYRQGREIAFYIPTHHKGRVPNAPMTWGPQPYKGHIFFTDWNSGLWAIKLEEGSGRRR
ncbi:MAG: Ig-like domain-containing protein [Planctomycetota bacterium]|nr:Ig-like domain-containing protein [Planctomycetota bacterium]